VHAGLEMGACGVGGVDGGVLTCRYGWFQTWGKTVVRLLSLESRVSRWEKLRCHGCLWCVGRVADGGGDGLRHGVAVQVIGGPCLRSADGQLRLLESRQPDKRTLSGGSDGLSWERDCYWLVEFSLLVSRVRSQTMEDRDWTASWTESSSGKAGTSRSHQVLRCSLRHWYLSAGSVDVEYGLEVLLVYQGQELGAPGLLL